jgi:hypothetical protein
MISPPGLMLKRPGILIPVFFLSLFPVQVTCQWPWPETGSAALGGCSMTGHGYSCAGQNQAGLGFIEHSSFTFQHCRPYLLREIGISTLSAQFKTGKGALGISMASRGIKGFRQTSMWLSYGMKLNPDISTGVGIHLWNSALQEQFIYAPGISFALGLQIRINDHWRMGGGLYHPDGWSGRSALSVQQSMAIETGFSYAFLDSGHLYSEIHIQPGNGLISCIGLDWTVNQRTIFRVGVSSKPFTFSWGISQVLRGWVLEFSFQCRIDSGVAPFTSITHAW